MLRPHHRGRRGYVSSSWRVGRRGSRPQNRQGLGRESWFADPSAFARHTFEETTTMPKTAVTQPKTMDEYAAWVREAGLDAPWSRPGELIASKQSRVAPFIWRWADIAPRLERSPHYMAPGEGGERRILRLVNPGVPELTSAHTLSVAVQYLLPGETAPMHAHSPNALRFMMHGEGAYTVVEGHKCAMSRGDLVLTPHMTVHSHGNEGSGPVIWVDVLDSPVVRYLEILSMQHPTEMPAPDRNLQ